VRWTTLVTVGAFGLVTACGGEEGDGGGNDPLPVGGAGASGAGVGSAIGGVGGAAGSTVVIGGAGTPTLPATGGAGGSGGSGGAVAGGTGGSGGAGGAGGSGGSAGGGGSGGPMLEGNFSFFVASVDAMIRLSGSEMGFGGDLGGLAGADEICQTIASEQGAGHKTWRAFLSATAGGAGGGPVHAIDRIGEGPWYDRLGRLIAMNRQGLLQDRPDGDEAAVEKLPNEEGVSLNQNGDDDHDILTGSDEQGQLNSDFGDTCNDWTSSVGSTGRPQCGHAWPSTRSGTNWIESHRAPGCAPCVALIQTGAGMGTDCVGGAGGYGGIYCFATTP
jgi:hypothetical protein